MKFQFNTDNSIDGGNEMAARIEADLTRRLERILENLTRIEVHIGDANGERGGPDDKICTIEARPAGMDPLTVTDHASEIDAAVAGAAAKLLVVYERAVGRITSRKGH